MSSTFNLRKFWFESDQHEMILDLVSCLADRNDIFELELQFCRTPLSWFDLLEEDMVQTGEIILALYGFEVWQDVFPSKGLHKLKATQTEKLSDAISIVTSVPDGWRTTFTNIKVGTHNEIPTYIYPDGTFTI